MSVDVGDPQLCAGVGSFLAPDDSHPSRPRREVEQPGQLGSRQGDRPDAVAWVYAGFAVASVAVSGWGLLRWRAGDRQGSLQLFEIALLGQLFIVQFFRLLEEEFAGYFLVFVNLALLGLCRALRFEDRAPLRRRAGPPRG